MKHSVITHVASILIACSTLTHNTQTISIPIDARDLENLAITGNTHQNTLEKKLNHCHTQAGKDYFTKSLCELSPDIDTLRQRQDHLKLLIGSPETVKNLNHQLKTCKNIESVLNAFSAANNSTPSVLDEFYFKRSFCTHLNKSADSLNASFFLHYIHLFTPILEHTLLHLGIDSVFSSNEHGHDHAHAHGHSCCSTGNHSHSNQPIYYLIQGAHWTLHAPGYIEILMHMHTRKKKISHAQAEIAQLKSYLKAAQSIYIELMANNPMLAKTDTPTLARIFTARSNDPVSIIVTKLIRSSWKSSLQSTLNPGSILAMHATLKAQTPLLQEIVREVGIIDAYTNIAQTMLAHKDHYCFATFIESAQPQIQMNNLWHHGIATESMKPLMVTLDKHNPCLIIRGANGSGKSTLLTAVGHALFLSQSWGIAPAQTATITPFSHFYTHSLKRDCIENGLSHFYYEHAYYEKMFAQNNNGHAIVLLDEPYMCTNFQTGTKYLKALTEHVQLSPQKLGIITTHYDE